MKRNGITLIALIITIVILLIISGVAIVQLTNNGLINKSLLAKNKYENETKNEQNKIENMETYIKSISRSQNENVLSKDISDFKPNIDTIYATCAEVSLPEIKVDNSNEIVGFAYLLDGEFQIFSKELKYKYTFLNKNTQYTIQVVAMDKNWKAKYSDEVVITTKNEYDLADYVQDGLLVHFDGIKNTEDGTHNSNATNWYNWGDNKNYSIGFSSSGLKWNEDSLNFQGGNLSISTIQYSNISIQALICDDNGGVIVSTQENGGFSMYRNSMWFNGLSTLSTPTKLDSNVKALITATYGNGKGQFWQNNNCVSTVNGTHSPNGYWTGIGIDPYADCTRYYGKIYTVRIYDRVLSDKEVELNYQVDKERYNIP